MAGTTAPLLSFDAAGTVAKTVVYSRWRGIKYARRYVIPGNPRTTAQQLTRTTFAFLREVWKMAPAGLQAPWNDFAKGRPFTGMNKLVGENLRVLRGELDLANFIASPGSGGGLPLVTFLPVTGAVAGTIDWTATVPDPVPPGWVVTAVWAFALKSQDPSGILDWDAAIGSDAVAPYAGTLEVGAAGEDYIVCGWIEWEKPDGSTAYGVSMGEIVTSDA